MNEELIKNLTQQFKRFLIIRKSEDVDKKAEEFMLLLTGRLETNTMSDEIMDFFDIAITGTPTRWETFATYIEKEFPVNRYPNILDVGCGPLADLSVLLMKKGYNVVGMDLRLVEEVNTDKLKLIKKMFDYRQDITMFDGIVGLEPCAGAGHIAKCNKPCIVSLCAAPHDSIDGIKFSSIEEWHNHLISTGTGIITIEDVKVLGKQHTIMRRK